MEVVERAQRIAASIEVVWPLIADFGGDRLTKGYVAWVECRGDGVGAERVYHLEKHLFDGSITERLLRLDHDTHELEYAIVDYGLVPITRYRGLIAVARAGRNACHVYLRACFMPVGVDAASAVAMSSGNIELFFENLRAAVGVL